jgi:predicted PurR-regulated permease PerM
MAGIESSDERRGLRFLITGAALVVVVWGLQWAAPVILPLLSAAFLAILCIPPMRRLESYGLPTWLALIAVVTGATVVLFLVATLVGSSLAQFQDQLGFYQARLNAAVADAVTWLASTGVDVDPKEVTASFDTGAVMTLVSDVTQSLLAAAGNLFIVVLTMIFILIEANQLPEKVRAARRVARESRGRDLPAEDDLAEYRDAAAKVHDYLAIKALVSGATGLCAIALTFALGIDFPLLWGLLAFLFNFVPNIGSVIAAVPPVLLALIQKDLVTAALVGAGYGAINLVLGNLIEPKLMGDRLGLSTLVVFVSLIFWGWVWGPLGMLLSVPLTVMVKILLEHAGDLRPLAILLGPGIDRPTSSE